jgi:hypothetical protein
VLATGPISPEYIRAERLLDLAPSPILAPGAAPLLPPTPPSGGRRLPATQDLGHPGLLEGQRSDYVGMFAYL